MSFHRSWRNSLLQAVNFVGNALPKGLQRRLSDAPGMLALLERLGGQRRAQATSPEGTTLVYSPLFHAHLFSNGTLETYEPELRNALSATVRTGMVAYDIGANVGAFTLQLAHLVGPGGHVFAFEPDPLNYSFLKETVTANLLSQVTVVNYAIADATGAAQFDRRGGGFSGRLSTNDARYTRTRNAIMVHSASLDDLIAAGQILPPNVVKIDVEGNEALVLRGMRHTLSAYKPIVACEIHTSLGDRSTEVEAELSLARYQWKDLGTSGRERQILARPLYDR